MEEFVIIVAGGKGTRMKSEVPKQFFLINGMPVLMHTIQAFRKYSAKISIILVLPEDQFDFWNNLCQEHSFDIEYALVKGGETRFHSVKNGLASISVTDGFVAVHDGVRPVINKEIIESSFLAAQEFGTAVTCVNLKDSIRFADQNGSNKAMERTDFRLIQTPQTFRLEWMRKAFSVDYNAGFTDCASVLEASGYSIHLIEGAYENIKITTPEDLVWAEIFLK
ncbi:2-C-methyl-D-erythritol 4-phosphate cytidylyltransferase [Dyadobacter sediminis]|uniref:2-C-methyl-D-erythritol 4-phosphate cytidylyltransferase n=1 Tax=Dyadobacter sediminis TaxID=1493691 RepID=A0A5R9KD75_9BACT|nr:2-C-methyl-D-erythritol 4-phosphate cytidylyltransferase [Dyadobacter sediminis]TLU94084.1 2-C-methyl-D-erythritol 4-phosphate cytidylyltransferase [Dyadobacter sediminis]GGB94368.1 2-C-methyl-D-erythritol 4-phosphate cytidylyltransferase [Dyadobacter sediminis]